MVSHSTHLQNGIDLLKETCPHLAKFVDISDRCNLKPQKHSVNLYYESLVKSIVAQQISTQAALTISNRLSKLTRNNITPRVIANKKDKQLAEVGLSKSKIKAIKGLATSQLDKEIDLALLKDMSDAEAVKTLSSQFGIGRWTAEMFLIFGMGRMDILPLGDLGLRNGIAKLFDIDKPSDTQITKIASKWSPYRTVATWYIWKGVKNFKNV